MPSTTRATSAAATSASSTHEGYVTITGRLKDVIIRHGENISAKEVEDLLYAHPAVADVAVIGLPDPKTGERACAVVAVKEGQSFEFDDMVAYLRGRGLRVQAIPEQLELVDVGAPQPGRQDPEAHAARDRTRRARTETGGEPMSPIQRVTLGQGGAEHDAADASHQLPHRASLRRQGGRGHRGRVGDRPGGGRPAGREGATVAALDVAADNLAATVAGISAEGGHSRRLPLRRHLGVVGGRDGGVVGRRARAPRPWCATWPASVGFYNTVDMPLERWEQILAVNLTGPFLVCRATLPHLLEHGGSIVNVASNTALMGQAYSAAYCASKAGLLMFSKALAAEYLSRGVRVNVVAPGGVDTPLIGTFELPEGADSEGADQDHDADGVLHPGRDRRLGGLHRLRRVVLHHGRGALGRRRADHLSRPGRSAAPR